MLGGGILELVNNAQTAGYKSVQWNATNDKGKPVSSGVYLYHISAGNYSSIKKMLLLK